MNKLEKMLLTGTLVAGSLVPFSVNRNIETHLIDNVYAQEEKQSNQTENYFDSINLDQFNKYIHDSSANGNNYYTNSGPFTFLITEDDRKLGVSIFTDVDFEEYLSLNYFTSDLGSIRNIRNFNFDEIEENIISNNWIDLEDFRIGFWRAKDDNSLLLSIWTNKSKWSMLNNYNEVRIRDGSHTRNFFYVPIRHKDKSKIAVISLENLYRKRCEYIKNYGFPFKEYHIAFQPKNQHGSSDFVTFWSDEMMENKDAISPKKLKPIAVTSLGREIPGATSTPFTLNGISYDMVYDAGKDMWNIRELK